MLRDSVVVVVVCTRPRAIPLAMITMRKSTHGFPFVFHIWVAYGALLQSLLYISCNTMQTLRYIVNIALSRGG